MLYTPSSGKKLSVVLNTRPSIPRCSDVLNTLPDMPRFSRALVAFQKARLRLPSLHLIYLVVPLRANILTPRSMTTVHCARVDVPAEGGRLSFHHSQAEQALV